MLGLSGKSLGSGFRTQAAAQTDHVLTLGHRDRRGAILRCLTPPLRKSLSRRRFVQLCRVSSVDIGDTGERCMSRESNCSEVYSRDPVGIRTDFGKGLCEGGERDPAFLLSLFPSLHPLECLFGVMSASTPSTRYHLDSQPYCEANCVKMLGGIDVFKSTLPAFRSTENFLTLLDSRGDLEIFQQQGFKFAALTYLREKIPSEPESRRTQCVLFPSSRTAATLPRSLAHIVNHCYSRGATGTTSCTQARLELGPTE